MEIKYIPFIINNMTCFEQYIMSRFPKLDEGAAGRLWD